MKKDTFVWDKVVRSTHWLVAAIVVANSFVLKPGSESHQLLGFVAVGLVTLRILWSLSFAKAPARFCDLIPTPSGLLHHLQELIQRQETAPPGHNAFGLLAIWLMWACIFALAFTGYSAENTDWGIMNDLDDWHQYCVWLLQSVVILHVVAVFATGLWFKRNLVKPMVRK